MLEFFEKYGPFFIVVAIVGGFIFYSVKKEEKEKEEKEKKERDSQNKTGESQKKER
jgi:hypothetical protein